MNVIVNWHGPIQEVTTNDVGLPGCPYCGGVLYEYPTRKEWDEKARQRAIKENLPPQYIAWLETLHCPCVPLSRWNWRRSLEQYIKIHTEGGKK